MQIIIAVCVLSMPHCTANAQAANTDSMNTKMSSPEEVFGRQLFKAFQTNDEAIYAALQPTNEEYKALLQTWLAAKVKGLTQAKIDGIIGRRKREAAARFQQDFTSYRSQAADAGVVWAKAVYQGYDNQPIYPEEVHQKYIYGTIWFSINGVRYLIEEVQAVEIPEGYSPFSIPNSLAQTLCKRFCSAKKALASLFSAASFSYKKAMCREVSRAMNRLLVCVSMESFWQSKLISNVVK